MANEREITVIATRGQKVKKFQVSNDVTWGELKNIISSDYDLESVAAVENVNKTTLNRDDASVPNGNVRIFLRPVNTKSGASIRSMVSTSPAKNDINQYCKDNFAKNWTHATTAELEQAWEDCIGILAEDHSTQEVRHSIEEKSVLETMSFYRDQIMTKLCQIESLINSKVSSENEISDDEMDNIWNEAEELGM